MKKLVWMFVLALVIAAVCTLLFPDTGKHLARLTTLVEQPAFAQQKPKPTPTPDPDAPMAPCDCIANPCCYSPYATCPTCCNGVPCELLSDAAVAAIPGKRKRTQAETMRAQLTRFPSNSSACAVR